MQNLRFNLVNEQNNQYIFISICLHLCNARPRFQHSSSHLGQRLNQIFHAQACVSLACITFFRRVIVCMLCAIRGQRGVETPPHGLRFVHEH